ncbi:serine/threonine-protein phosphatase 7 long form [Salvia divinorum]|uniref:Serine/threonine-protein phosphatase 7 long form n=1 Tax=Salvia divinorum TaxID=28513 RepID=A0ABD1HR65_SALDI
MPTLRPDFVVTNMHTNYTPCGAMWTGSYQFGGTLFIPQLSDWGFDKSHFKTNRRGKSNKNWAVGNMMYNGRQDTSLTQSGRRLDAGMNTIASAATMVLETLGHVYLGMSVQPATRGLAG